MADNISGRVGNGSARATSGDARAGNDNGHRGDEEPDYTNNNLLQPPPLSTSALAKLIGMSATFVRMEIKQGAIHAIRVGHGRKCVYRIPFKEAMRYARRLGLL
jgi:hypothetical protein